jgi:hypothetical protein
VAAAALVGDCGCAALLLDELDAVVEIDDELLQAARHSDITHTKINLGFTAPAHPMVSRRHATWIVKGTR